VGREDGGLMDSEAAMLLRLELCVRVRVRVRVRVLYAD
jgi:hypothetical protein